MSRRTVRTSVLSLLSLLLSLRYPAELDASVLLRLPCRTTTDDRYFGDEYQALPKRGYTRIFENMLLQNPKISIRLNVDFFKARPRDQLALASVTVCRRPMDLALQPLV